MNRTLIPLTLLAAISLSAAAVAQQPQRPPPAQQIADPPKQDVDSAVAKVRQALRNEKDVPADSVSVTTHADTIVLTGEVANAAVAARASAAAEAAAGGIRVSSSIKVLPEDEQTPAVRSAEQQDLALVRNVEQALKRDQRTADLGVQVSVEAGRVIGLHGLVPSPASRSAAEGVARQVSGVARVNNRLVVPGE